MRFLPRSAWLHLLWPWAMAGAVCLAAVVARTFLIQPPDIAQACEAHSSWWCQVRMAIIYTYAWHTVGQVAVILVLFTLVVPRVALAAAALAVGFAALVLYCYEPGAFSVIAAALLLARAQAQQAAPKRITAHAA